MKQTKLRFFSILGILAITAFSMAACSDDKDKTDNPVVDPGTEPGTDPGTEPGTDPGTDPGTESGHFFWNVNYGRHDYSFDESMNSDAGCIIDNDCAEGKYCFHSSCVSDCKQDSDCGEGQKCAENGRCIIPMGKLSLLRKLTPDEDYEIAKSAATQDLLAGVEIVDALPNNIDVKVKQTEVTVSLTTSKNMGTVKYIVITEDNINGSKDVQTVEPEMVEVTGDHLNSDKSLASYTFKIAPKKANLGEQAGEKEVVYIDSNLGFFKVVMRPQKQPSGLYEGTVTAPQFGGIPMNLRMGIVVTPKDPASFADITGIDIYLPSSEDDLFSPTSPETGKTQWNKVKMKRETSAVNCAGGAAGCWTASFSSNNFVMPGSQVIRADQQVNRSIRIELSDFSAKNQRFTGTMRDFWQGLYRISENGKSNWATPTLNGQLMLYRSKAFDTEALKADITSHIADNYSRNAEDAGIAAGACTDNGKAALIAYAQNVTGCTSADKLADANCLDAAIDGVINDSNKKLVSTIIPALISGDAENSGGFANLGDFMTDCLKDDGVCAERPEIACAVDLLAQQIVNDESISASKVETWIKLMRESYLGVQYRAWQVDVDVREDWLKGGSAPSFLSPTLEQLNTEMLQKWEADVLDAHVDVVGQQFSQASLELLSRYTDSDIVKSLRKTVLADMSQAWEGVSDALNTGANRYNVLYTDDIQRKETAKRLNRYLFDLYFTGIVESAMNIRADQTSLNASFGKNLAAINDNIAALKMPFDDLVYLRDAEIVVSASLSNIPGEIPSVLTSRKKLAKDTIAAAAKVRDTTLETKAQKDIAEAEIKDRLSTNLENLKNEIVSICGTPTDCKGVAFNGTDECIPDTDYLLCGFKLAKKSSKVGNLQSNSYDKATLDLLRDRDQCPGDPDKTKSGDCGCGFIEVLDSEKNTQIDENGEFVCSRNPNAKLTLIDLVDIDSTPSNTTAGNAVYKYREAYADYEIAVADYQALVNKIQNTKAYTEGYAANIEKWNQNRTKLIQDVMANVNAINLHLDNVTTAQKNSMLASAQQLQTVYEKQHANFRNWKKISKTYLEDQDARIHQVAALESTVLFVDATGEFLYNAGDAVAEYTEDGAFGGNIPGGVAKTAGTLAKFASDLISASFQTSAINIQEEADRATLKYEYDVELKDRKLEDEIAKAEAEFQQSLSMYEEAKSEEDCDNKLKQQDKATQEYLHCYEHRECECDATGSDGFSIYHGDNCPVDTGKCTLKTSWSLLGADQWALMEENDADTIDQINDYMRELFDSNDVYARDLNALDQKRTELLNLEEDLNAKALAVTRAALVIHQAESDYFALVDRAKRLKEQYDAANARMQDIANLYNTPAAVFSYASDLDVVETKMELARDRIYDYLAAVEYLAVRPFVDLRRATYLARSTNDLDAIVDQIDTITENCGGIVNSNTVTFSLRELMGITTDFTGMTKEERFRYVLKKRNIPVDAVTRYTVDSNVRDLLASGRDLRAGTFELTTDADVNLASTCNAKITSIGFKLVGENLLKDGVQNAHPTMTLFYNGQAQLISCQPNIADLVTTLGGKSAFGPISTFHLKDLKISPTAGINEFMTEPNSSLANYPLAATYTVLIDTSISENPKINWDNVTDIELQIKYNYQDLFTNSKCEKL